MKIEYREVSLDAIFRRSAEQFAANLPEGQSLYSHHAFVDVQKGVVVFKFYIDGEKKKTTGGERHATPCPDGFWVVPHDANGIVPVEGVCSICGGTAKQHL